MRGGRGEVGEVGAGWVLGGGVAQKTSSITGYPRISGDEGRRFDATEGSGRDWQMPIWKSFFVIRRRDDDYRGKGRSWSQVEITFEQIKP